MRGMVLRWGKVAGGCGGVIVRRTRDAWLGRVIVIVHPREEGVQVGALAVRMCKLGSLYAQTFSHAPVNALFAEVCTA